MLKIFTALGIFAAGLFNQLKYDFEKRQNNNSGIQIKWKKFSMSPKYVFVTIKIVWITFVSFFFVSTVNMFTSYRNICCTEFYESLLNHPDHGKHIIKQLCLFFICFYIFFISHKSVKHSGSILTQIFRILFCAKMEDIENMDQARTSIEDQPISFKKNETNKFENFLNFFYPNENNTEFYVTFVLNLSSLFLIIFLSKHDLFAYWTISFLTLNFSIISSVLLINYFPYQVLVKSDTSKAIFFSNKESVPLINQKENQKTKIYNQTLKEEKILNDEREIDNQSIDQIFAEHMGELKIKALSDKDVSFGEKQPNMKSAYKAIIGFILFVSSSISYNLVLNFFQVNLNNLLNFFYFLTILIGLVLINFIISIIFFLKNTKETIFVKKLNDSTFLLPFNQLLLIFFSIFLIFRFDLKLINIFVMTYFSFLFSLFIYFKLFSIYFVKKIQKQIFRRDIQQTYIKDSNIFIIN